MTLHEIEARLGKIPQHKDPTVAVIVEMLLELVAELQRQKGGRP